MQGKSFISHNEKTDRIQYSINNLGNIIRIDFIKRADGLLTITPNVGVNIPISTDIAEYIYSKVANVFKNSPFSNGFSILIPYDDFNIVLDLVKTMNGVILKSQSNQLEDGKAKYYLYQFSGPAGDSVTVKYFISTNRMQLQGKPLWLFNEIVSLVSENGAKMDDVIDAHLHYCSVTMKIDDIYEEMESVLGTDLYNYLPNTHKAILSTSFIMSKIDVEMPDYSVLIQQALRAFEGFIKKIYAQKGLICSGDKQLGMFFTRPNKTSPFTIQAKYDNIVNDDDKKRLIDMYTFYYEKRHPYFHSGANDVETRIISNKKIAEEKFNEIINYMKSWYQSAVIV